MNPAAPNHTSCGVPRVANAGIVTITDVAAHTSTKITPSAVGL